MTRGLGAILLLAAAALPARGDALTAAERRGREIFWRGTNGRGGRLSATLNDAPAPVTFGCAGCHGRDGRGRAEGGIRPPDIRWDTLVQPRPASGEAWYPRPAYDPRTLTRAVTMGLDPSGRRLDAVMPRYHLMREDADDLLAFLGRLGGLSDPGLSADDFRVGVFLPAGRQRAATRRAITAWAAELQARGGIYGRRPEVLFLENGAGDLEGLEEESEPLAVVGDPGAGSLDRAAAWVEAREVPWVRTAPLTGVRSLEDALKRAGRDVSRERLALALGRE